MPPGFHRLIAAQFFSALADNALLIVAIALLQRQHQAAWMAPLLKFFFIMAYVLLAPWLGPLADSMPKARLMAFMNGLKALGALLLLAGVHPLAAFAVAGIGAAAYAPAKYGLITEIVPPEDLVAANGWIEVSVVGAVLLGAACGGLLVSDAWLAVVPGGLAASLVALLAVYLLAGALNLGLPDSGARYPRSAIHPLALAREFAADLRTLWRDPEGGLSLAATALFWGVGATLQFIVLRWAGESLGLPLAKAAYLQATVALGVVAGAAAAGRFVPLAGARRVLVLGIALGLAMPLMTQVHELTLALPTLVLVGAVGGGMVVPMNALLQHRGCRLMSAGRSIAVQGFSENASVLAMLAGYAALGAAGVPLDAVMTGLGLLMAGVIAWLAWRGPRRARQALPAGR